MPDMQDKIVQFKCFKQPEAFKYKDLIPLKNAIYAVRPLNIRIKGTEDLQQFNFDPLLSTSAFNKRLRLNLRRESLCLHL